MRVEAGRVVVAFAPGGDAQSATHFRTAIRGHGDRDLRGGAFPGVHVPAFGGSPFSVSKSFTIN